MKSLFAGLLLIGTFSSFANTLKLSELKDSIAVSVETKYKATCVPTADSESNSILRCSNSENPNHGVLITLKKPSKSKLTLKVKRLGNAFDTKNLTPILDGVFSYLEEKVLASGKCEFKESAVMLYKITSDSGRCADVTGRVAKLKIHFKEIRKDRFALHEIKISLN